MRRGENDRVAAIALASIAMVIMASCRPVMPPGGPRPSPPEQETAGVQTPQTERGEVSAQPVSRQPPSDSVSSVVAAIIDSIEAVVRDSIEQVARDSMEAAARRDSIAAVARRDSLAEVARLDSIAEVARRDSIEAAARDSVAAEARRDSILAVARQDSIEAAVADSVAAAARRDSLAEIARLDSIAEVARLDSIAEAGRLDSIAAAPITEDLDQLRELGPSYIPYDRGPRLVWDTEAQASVATTLLPIIREEDLEARTATYFWLLVRADGTVDQAILQTSSGSAAFDAAAERAARGLLFAPAIRGERAVPTWIVRDISLLME